ncbi:MAG TPA: hypothetical protein VFO39_04785 [Candidatus Sulfotelmatobacter sp.]|nr:hypothetical protein [Candidatus Sulfotelmatobacter sp.]
MYKGRVIWELMTVVEGAERQAQLMRLEDERELQRIFDLQVSYVEPEQALVGAA